VIRKSQEAAMSHAALVSDGLFWLVLLMTLLLAMFVYAVVVTPPEQSDRSSEEPALEPPTSPPPVPVPALPARRPQAPTSSAGPDRPSGGASYPARHTPAAAPVILAPQAPSGPRRGSKLASILGIAGLVAAVSGGWLFLGATTAAKVCPHQGLAICAQRFVVLTGPQVLGGAIALAGIAVGFIALWLALH
jgi:hypothetical protein